MKRAYKYLQKNFFKSVFVFIFAVALLLAWFFIFGIATHLSGSHFNKGHNAIWIGHQWVGQDKSNAEIEALISELQTYGFDTIFVHSGPFKSDGSIDPQTYRYSVDFVAQAKQLAPEMEFQAWLGQLRKRVDLSDASVRKNMVNQSIIMTQMVGFDGIHYDIEPVWDNDTDFIKLLEETREAIGDEKTISVALAEFIPSSVIWFMEPVHEFRFYNTESNYENVAQFADQVVVMTYDTSLNDEWLYRWLVKEQTIWVTSVLKDFDTEIFIALPAYDEPTPAFNPEIENLETGIKGVVEGLNNVRSEEANFAGIAIYPYWLIDEGEWQTYNELWGE